MGKILRVDMKNLEVREEAYPQEYEKLCLGGRGLTSYIVSKEVEPTCNPLGEKNKLVIAPGLLSGTTAPCSGRLSVGGKSPLTGTIKEANVGGTISQKMARLGIKAIVVEGKPETDTLYVLKVDQRGAQLLPYDELKEKGNFDTVEALKKAYGEKVSILSIGQAGERCYCNSSVAVTDTYLRPDRHAARGGLGAVMGSKRLKAIVVDDTGGSAPKAKDEQAFKEAVRVYAEGLSKTEEGFVPLIRAFGTPGALNVVNALGEMPTRNYRAGSFKGAYNLSGERIAEVLKERGGKMHSCHPGCVLHCSTIYNDKDGQYLVSGLEYETLALCGANLEIDDLDAIAEMNRLCNDIGLDTIETGSTLGVVMDAGLLSFGDAKGAIEAIKEIGEGTPWGRTLGQGVYIVGKVLGTDRIPHVKGQAIPAHHPSVTKVVGVTYSTSPMGADHTAGMIFHMPITDPTGKVPESKELQLAYAANDDLGFCLFTVFYEPWMECASKITSAFLGKQWGVEDLLELGKVILKAENTFNRKAGLGLGTDRLPEFFKEVPVPPTNSVFDVPQEEIDKFYEPL